MISISDLRTLGRERPVLNDALLEIIAGAEALRVQHEIDCGCPEPGALWTGCTWKGSAAYLLAHFAFDEVVA